MSWMKVSAGGRPIINGTAEPALTKLQAEAEALASEGWKWIEVATDLPYGYSHGLRRLAGDPAPMTDEESAAHAVLLTEYRELEEEYSFGAVPADEIDGDEVVIVSEYDPFG